MQRRIGHIILLIGKIGSGKSTTADILSKKYGFKELMFAEPIKEIAKILGFEKKEVYGSQKEKLEKNKFWNISGREFMQLFGTDICRDIIPKKIPQLAKNNQTIWVNCMEKKIIDNLSENLVISDGRFLDEILLVKKYSGIVVKIENHKSDLYNSDLHKSELDLKDFQADFIINNSGSIGDLYQEVDELIKILKY